LLTQAKPDRLFIEPTGLGHPDQLLEQLSEPHWAKALSMRAVVTVVNGLALSDPRLLLHDTFVVQIQTADIVLVSNQDGMTEQHVQQLEKFKAKFIQPQQQVMLMQHGEVDLALLDQPHHTRVLKRRSLLHTPAMVVPSNVEVSDESTDLPYHYVEDAVGHSVAGWRLPADWQFDRNQLLNCLFAIQGWLRIKGVIHLDGEWMSLNLTPSQIGMSSRESFTDNRLEIISEQAQDWGEIEQQLMACILPHP
jgi:G3E family GTPase